MIVMIPRKFILPDCITERLIKDQHLSAAAPTAKGKNGQAKSVRSTGEKQGDSTERNRSNEAKEA